MSGPSFYGYIRDAADAEMVFRAAAENKCKKIVKRLHYKADNIRDGQGYVYEEQQSKIKRWTDGFNWGDSYHPGGKVMIYKEVDIIWEDNRIKKVEKVNGLRKKTIADYNSPMRIVCYYYEKEIMHYGPIRLCPDKPSSSEAVPSKSVKKASPAPSDRSRKSSSSSDVTAPSKRPKAAEVSPPPTATQDELMDASALCVSSLLRAAGCLDAEDNLPPPPRFASVPPSKAQIPSPVASVPVPSRKRPLSEGEVRQHKMLRPEVYAPGMPAAVPHYEMAAFEHMRYPPMPVSYLAPPGFYPGYHHPAAFWHATAMSVPQMRKAPASYSIENILCQ